MKEWLQKVIDYSNIDKIDDALFIIAARTCFVDLEQVSVYFDDLDEIDFKEFPLVVSLMFVRCVASNGKFFPDRWNNLLGRINTFLWSGVVTKKLHPKLYGLKFIHK